MGCTKVKVQLLPAVIVVFGTLLVRAVPLENKSLNGDTKCNAGPAVWCSVLENAKACNAVDHCIQTVWSKTLWPNNDSFSCIECKKMVARASFQLTIDQNVNNSFKIVRYECSKVSNENVHEKCNFLAENHLTDFVKLMEFLNEGQTCATMGFCRDLQHQQGKDLQSLTPCESCKQISSLMRNKFVEMDRFHILDTLLRLCNKLDANAAMCANAVLTHFNDFHDHVTKNLDDFDICAFNGMCADELNLNDKLVFKGTAIVAVGDELTCTLCQRYVEFVHKHLVAHKTEVQTKEFMHELCARSRHFKQECNSLVDQYYDLIYWTVITNFDGPLPCMLIGLCPMGAADRDTLAQTLPFKQNDENNPESMDSEFDNLVREHLTYNEFKLAASLALYIPSVNIDETLDYDVSPSEVADDSNTAGNGECRICKLLMKIVRTIIKSKMSKYEITRTLDKGCDLISKKYMRKPCHKMVEKYGGKIANVIQQKKTVQVVCSRVLLCNMEEQGVGDIETDEPEELYFDEHLNIPEIIPNTAGVLPEIDESLEHNISAPQCTVCKLLMKLIQHEVRKHVSKNDIKHVLDRGCNKMHGGMRNKCYALIRRFGDRIADLILQKKGTRLICRIIQLCDAGAEGVGDIETDEPEEFYFDEHLSIAEDIPNTADVLPEIDESLEHNISAPQCTVCKLLMKLIQHEVRKHVSKNDIKHVLDRGCNKMHGGMRNKCYALIRRFGDRIADLILQKKGTRLICRIIQLCDAGAEGVGDIETDEPEEFYFDEHLSIAEDIPNTADVLPEIDESLEHNISAPQCTVCKLLMKLIQHEVRKHVSKNDIKHVLDRGCNKMHGGMRNKCHALIRRFGDRIADLILQKKGTKLICRIIQLCHVDEEESEMHEAWINDQDKSKDMDSNDSNVEIGGTCVICKLLMKLIQHQIEKKVPQAQIIQIMEKGCNLAPIKKMRKKCFDLVGKYGAKMADLIVHKKAGKVVCSVILLCDAEEPRVEGNLDILQETRENIESYVGEFYANTDTAEKKSITPCDTCKHVSSLLRDTFFSMDRADTLDNILYLCSRLDSYAEICANAVRTHFNDIYDLITQNVAEFDICGINGMCSDDLNQHYEEEGASVGDAFTCDQCELYVNILRETLVDYITESRVKKVMMQLCKYSHEPQKVCYDFVAQYYQRIYRSFVHIFDGNLPCIILRACNRSNENFNTWIQKVPFNLEEENTNIENEDPDDEFVVDGFAINILNTEMVENGEFEVFALENHDVLDMSAFNGCKICNLLMDMIRPIINSTSSKDRITRTLEKGCDLVTKKSWRKNCYEIVGNYGAKIIDFVLHQKLGKAVCSLVFVCNAEEPGVRDIETDEPVEYYIARDYPNTADVVPELDETLEYDISAPDTADYSNRSKPQCAVCKLLMKLIKHEVRKHISKNDVKHVLDKGCDKMAGGMRDKCHSLVVRFGDRIADLILQRKGTKGICRLMQLCHMGEDGADVTATEMYEALQFDYNFVGFESELNLHPKPPYGCSNCTTLVTKAQQLLKKRLSKQEILHALDLACNQMPVCHLRQCHAFVWNYRDDLVKHFLKEEEPLAICTALQQCQPGPSICSSCKNLMRELNARIKSAAWQHKMKRSLETICEFLPKSAAKTCKTYVDGYGIGTIDLLAKIITDDFCQWLAVCPRDEMSFVTNTVLVKRTQPSRREYNEYN